jgi:hypothetical protein
MEESARNLSWCQGDILTDEAVLICNLKVAQDLPEPMYAVVISHDCDLAAKETTEPNAEVIIGNKVSKLGRDSFGKTARRLQIAYQTTDGEVVLELVATEKILVPKANLFKCAPCQDLRLDKQGRNIL